MTNGARGYGEVRGNDQRVPLGLRRDWPGYELEGHPSAILLTTKTKDKPAATRGSIVKRLEIAIADIAVTSHWDNKNHKLSGP
jgi:hypothetical protein